VTERGTRRLASHLVYRKVGERGQKNWKEKRGEVGPNPVFKRQKLEHKNGGEVGRR